MKRYLFFLAVSVIGIFANAGVPSISSSVPAQGGFISNSDVIVVTFSEAIRCNLSTTKGYTISPQFGGSSVYSAQGHFFVSGSSPDYTVVSPYIMINPSNNTQLLIDLSQYNITPGATCAFVLNARSIYSISSSQQMASNATITYFGAPPTLISKYPVHAQDNVLPNDTISLTYSSTVDFSYDNTKFFRILNSDDSPFWSTDGTDPLTEIIIDNNSVYIAGNPSLPSFVAGSSYKVVVDSAFFAGGIPGFSNGAWTFSVNEITAIAPFLPADGSTTASITADFSVTFSENISLNAGYVYIKNGATLVEQIPITSCSVSGATLTIPHSALNPATPYYIEMSKACVKSSSTNALFAGISGSTIWNFTTESANIWTGAVSNDFSAGGNWSAGSYNPLASVLISGGNNPARITTSVSAPDVTITSTGKLEIALGGTLTMSGKLKLESSATSNSSLVVNGTLTVNPTDVSVYQYAGNSSPSFLIKKGYASPVSGATGASAQTTRVIWKYDNRTNTLPTVSSSTTWDAGVGYITYASSPLVFTGAINTASSYTLPLLYTADPDAGIYSASFNLYGNPYTAPLDWFTMWHDLGTDTTLVSRNCWILKEGGSWTVINGKTGSVSNGSGTTIPRGHAFYLRANKGPGSGDGTDVTSSITFKKSYLVGGTQTYLKSQAAPVAPTNIRISAISTSFKTDVLYGFHQDASLGYDSYDSEALAFPNTSASYADRLQIATYTASGAPVALAINTVPNFVDSASFNVAYYVKNAGVYSLELTELDTIFKSENSLVTLKDTATHDAPVVMKQGDKYFFYANTTPSVEKSRFIITVYTSKAASILPLLNRDSGMVSAYFSNKSICIDVASQEALSVDVCDMNGIIVMKTELHGANKYSIPFENSGFYVVRVTGQEFSQSIKLVAK